MSKRLFAVAVCLVVLSANQPHAAERATARPAPLGIESEPAGAGVYVDGRFVGLTPLDVPRLAPGEHRVRVVKNGYLDNARVVTVGATRDRVVRVKLTPHHATTDESAAQVTSSNQPGGGSKKWLWIGAAAAGGGAAAYVATHRNSPPTISSVVVSPSSAVSSVTTVALTANAVDPDGDSLTYSWDFGDGATGAGQTTGHQYTRAGTFTPSVTVSDSKKSAAGSATVVVKSISGTWTGNLGSNSSTFFTMTFTQSGATFGGTYTDTVSGNGAVNAGQLTSPLGVSFAIQIPGFNAVNFTGVFDPNLDRITGNAVQYAGGPSTFYLNRR